MVKLNLTGLQTSDSSETPTGEQKPENTEETPIVEQSNYSFSLSSLIGNNNPTTQETTNTTSNTEETSILTQSTEEQPIAESLLSIEGISGKNDNSEEIFSINNEGEDGVTNEAKEDKVGTIPESNIEPEENREFFKGFDVIKEFNKEKIDEIVITKGEEKIELVTEENEKDITENITMIANNEESILEESILEENKDTSEISIAKVEETIIPTTQQVNSINTENKDEVIVETLGESISSNNVTLDLTIDDKTTTPIVDIEQAKKDLSATRKPFGIKSFSKKSVVTSLGALFVFGLVAVGLSQINFLGGKTNIQETMPKEVTPLVKYIPGTDYIIITNKKKNIKRPRETILINTGSQIGTGEQLISTGILLENSDSITMSGTINNSLIINEQNTSTATIVPLTGQGPNQESLDQESLDLETQQLPQGPNNNNPGIPTVESINTPANDMNDITNGIN